MYFTRNGRRGKCQTLPLLDCFLLLFISRGEGEAGKVWDYLKKFFGGELNFSLTKLLFKIF